MTASSARSRSSQRSRSRSAIAQRLATRSHPVSHGMGWDRSDYFTPLRDAYANASDSERR